MVGHRTCRRCLLQSLWCTVLRQWRSASWSPKRRIHFNLHGHHRHRRTCQYYPRLSLPNLINSLHTPQLAVQLPHSLRVGNWWCCASPNVQIYLDIDNSWAGQYGLHVSTAWNWALTPASAHVFTIGIGGGKYFTEVNDRAQWGQAAYCTQSGALILREKLGGAEAIRAEFVANGSLADSAWKWQTASFPIAMTGGIGSGKNVTFAVGYTRDVGVSYRGNRRSGTAGALFRTSTPDTNILSLTLLKLMQRLAG